MATVEAEWANHLRVIEAAYRKFLALIECIPEAAMLEPETVGEWSLEEVKADFAGTHYAFMQVAAASKHTNWQAVVRITKTHYEERTEDLKYIHAKVQERRQSPRAATAESSTL